MHEGTCIECGKTKPIDSAGYCSGCYPYSDSTDIHKRKTESNGMVPWGHAKTS